MFYRIHYIKYSALIIRISGTDKTDNLTCEIDYDNLTCEKYRFSNNHQSYSYWTFYIQQLLTEGKVIIGKYLPRQSRGEYLQ